MTNKEEEFLKWMLNNNNDEYNKPLIQGIIDKLEVLEILKTMIQQNDITLTPKRKKWNISNEDIKKLKEWLEDDAK